MQIKKHTEKVFIKQVVQYESLEEFREDYIKRIELGFKLTEPYYTNNLAFTYEKTKLENVIVCESFDD